MPSSRAERSTATPTSMSSPRRSRPHGGGSVTAPAGGSPGTSGRVGRRGVHPPAGAAGPGLLRGRSPEPRDRVAARRVRIGAKRRDPAPSASAQRMRRGDLAALGSGALIGAVVALGAVFVWSVASRPAGFPTTDGRGPDCRRRPCAVGSRADHRGPSSRSRWQPTAWGWRRSARRATPWSTSSRPSSARRTADERWTCPGSSGEVRFVQWADLGVFVLDGVFAAGSTAFFPPEFGPLLGVTMPDGLGIGVEPGALRGPPR